MTDRHNANLPEILRRQLGEHLPIDFVVAERRLVLLETQAAQPRCNVHSNGDALQWYLGTAAAEPTRPGLVPNRLDVVRQAAHGPWSIRNVSR